jgi:hypothetical protein
MEDDMIAPVDVTGGRFEYEGDGTEEDALAAKLGPDRCTLHFVYAA